MAILNDTLMYLPYNVQVNGHSERKLCLFTDLFHENYKTCSEFGMLQFSMSFFIYMGSSTTLTLRHSLKF